MTFYWFERAKTKLYPFCVMLFVVNIFDCGKCSLILSNWMQTKKNRSILVNSQHKLQLFFWQTTTHTHTYSLIKEKPNETYFQSKWWNSEQIEFPNMFVAFWYFQRKVGWNKVHKILYVIYTERERDIHKRVNV